VADESRPRALDAAGQVIATRMPGAAVARAARRGRSGRDGHAARAHTARAAARGSAASAGLPPARASPRAGLP